MARLGEPDDRFYAYVTGKEAEIEAATKNITSLVIKYENFVGEIKCDAKREALAAIDSFEKIINGSDNISKQFIERMKAIVGHNKGDYCSEEIIKLLEHAVKLTYPQFDIHKIETGYFSYDEVLIINQLANEYCENKQYDVATDILKQLLKNIDKRFTKISSGWTRKSLVQYSLSRCLLLTDNIESA